MNKILGIDTSCDDTAMAVVNSRLEILSNVVSSQAEVHQEYGGVYPSLAKREHKKNLPLVLKQALKRQEKEEINAIAVTVGPGLDPCLWQGINFAKKLARKWQIPIIPVNHIEAHIIANLTAPLSSRALARDPAVIHRDPSLPLVAQDDLAGHFPAIGLIVSGGTTELILIKDIGDYKLLGQTRDDAAGECFDKTARILCLPYPGGPAIAAEAARFKIYDSRFKIELPRPMLHSKDYDFSFSGLKTAVLYDYKERAEKVRESKNYIRAMAKEIQQAIIDVLIAKTLKAAKEYKAKTILLGGGVAANKELRKQFHYKLKTTNYKLNFLVPPKSLSTDNGAMIAATAFFHRDDATGELEKITAKPNLHL